MPTASLARELVAILARWTSMMREQSVTFDQMRLGLLRLDTFLLLGLERTFRFPRLVKDALPEEFQPSSSYSQSFPPRQ